MRRIRHARLMYCLPSYSLQQLTPHRGRCKKAKQGYPIIGFLLIYCTLQMISEQSQTAGNALITQKVYTYAGSNGLKLNVEKHEIFAARRCASSLNEFKTEENKISVKGAIKSIWHLGDQRQCGCAWIRIHIFKKSEEYSLLLRALAFFQSILLHQETCVKCVCSLYSYTAASTGLLTTN